MQSVEAIKIGDAAAALGIAAHVLRHWEDVGLLVPARSDSGHRTYDRRLLDQARMIRVLQRAGFALDQIRDLAVGSRDARAASVDARRAEIQRQVDVLRATDRFLAHLAACRHGVISECAECAAFAARHPLIAAGAGPDPS